MSDIVEKRSAALVEIAGAITSAYVSNNSVEVARIPDLLRMVYGTLTNLDGDSAAAPRAKPAPPVSIRKSVSDDYLVSLEDGRRYKSLKRHLSGRGLTPAQYREKWSLPYDYPMVAPNYAKQRSDLAKSMGLGRQTAEAARLAKAAKARRTASK